MTLPAEPESVRRARRFVAEALDGRVGDEVRHAAQVVITELSSNAMLHAATPFDVVVQAAGDDIRLEVHDGQPRLPRRKRYSDESTTGRGLLLVEALTSLAGAERTAGGKVVWAVLSEAAPEPPVPGEETDTAAAAASAPGQLPAVAAPALDDLRVAAQDDSWDRRAQLWAEQLLAPA